MKRHGKAFAVMALALALAVPAAGCAGKVKVRKSSKVMCEAHGGQYNSQTQMCSFAAAHQRSARQACQEQGGVYWPDEQYCDFEE